MKPQPGGGNQMMMGDGALQQRMRQAQQFGQNPNQPQMSPFPGIRRGTGPMERGPANPFLEQLQRSGASPEMVDRFAGFNQGPLPPQAQGVPNRGMPNLQGLGNIDALMQQRQMGAGGMNPFAQRLQQTGMNPALQNTVTAPVRPTGMEDRTPFAPRLRFNNPMQQGPANPEDAQRSRMQQALAGFGRFRNRGQ